MSLFPSILCTIAAFSSYGEYVVRLFLLLDMVFFYLVTTGSIFYITLSENSIIQPKHVFHLTTVHHLAFSDSPPPSTRVFPRCLSNSAYVLVVNPKKILFDMVVNPALGLLNRKMRSNRESLAA